MKDSLLSLLVCPACGARFEAYAKRTDVPASWKASWCAPSTWELSFGQH
jgi:uncharacterized protein YbaR (Trm112 family)